MKLTSPLRQKAVMPEEKRWDLHRSQDRVRSLLTVVLTIGMLMVVAAAFVAVFGSDKQWTHAKEGLQLILPIFTGSLGTVLGYYFGSRK
jgi:hypothetical protein